VQALELAAELRIRACAPDSENRLQKQPLEVVSENATIKARTSTTSTANATTTAARSDSEGPTVDGDAPGGKSLLGGPLFLQLHPHLQLLLQQKQHTGAQAARVRHSVALLSQLQSQQQAVTATTATTTADASDSARLHNGSAVSNGAYTNGSTVVRSSCSSGTVAPRLSTARKLTLNSCSSSNSTASTGSNTASTASAAITAATAATTAASATGTTNDMSDAVELSSSIATPRVSGISTPTVNNSTSSSSINSKHTVASTVSAAEAGVDTAIAAVSDSYSLVTPRVSILRKPSHVTGSSSTAANNTTTAGATTAAAAAVSSGSSEKGSSLSPQRPLRFRPSFGSHRGASPSVKPHSVELVVAEQDVFSTTTATEMQATAGAASDSSSSNTPAATAGARSSAVAFADIWPAAKQLTVRSVDCTDATSSTIAAAAAAAAAAAISGNSSSVATPSRASAVGLNSRRTFCADNGIPNGRCSLAAVSDALIFACSTAAMAVSSTSDITYAINSVVQSQKDSAVRNAALVESEHTMLFDNKGAVDTAIALSSQQIGAVVASSADLMTDALLEKLQAMSSKGNSSGSSGSKTTTSGSTGTAGNGGSGRKSLKPVTVVTAGRRKAPPALFKVVESAAKANDQ
jgi:trimeric autotransporter adhesin